MSDRRSIETASGRIAYVEKGRGPVALFVHGVFLNANLWDGTIAGVADGRRCLAPDILCHGDTEERPEADVSFAGQAAMLAQFLDALGVDQADVVANDSGGAIAQIFAARHPGRVRTLTLTNCDVHDGWPPPSWTSQFVRVSVRTRPGCRAAKIWAMAPPLSLATTSA